MICLSLFSWKKYEIILEKIRNILSIGHLLNLPRERLWLISLL